MTDPADRPDPLADPFEGSYRGSSPAAAAEGPDLTVCSHHPTPETRCPTPPSVIFWLGCLRGEHVGPLAACAHHAVLLGAMPMHCAQCGGEVRVMKITSMDGISTVALDPPQPGTHLPPPDLWQRATGPG